MSSKIGYALEAYGVAASRLINEIQVLQNRILKIIHYKDRKYPTNLLHKESKILKLTDLYKSKILKIMHGKHFKNENRPKVFKDYLKTNEDSHKYETRHKSDYKIYKSNKKWGDSMLKSVAARLWNDLLSGLKSIPNSKEILLASYQITSIIQITTQKFDQ